MFLFLVAPVSKAEDILYTVNLAFGSAGTAIGTITTDATQGVLDPSNIVSWNLALYDGTNSTTLTPSNSTVGYGVLNGPGANTDLSATPTTLLFNYEVGDFGSWDFSGTGGQGELCITSYSNCFGPADTFGTYGIGGDGQWVYSGASGTQVVAFDGTVVPEPSTLGLLGIGLVSIAGIFRKKVRHV
jgi:hypothetical protein